MASFLKNSTLALLSEIVTFTVSSLNASSSGEGRKSVITLTLPNGSSVYFIFLFIYLLSFPPISGTYDSDFVAAICKADCHYSSCNLTETIVSLLFTTVIKGAQVSHDSYLRRLTAPEQKELRASSDLAGPFLRPTQNPAFSS